MEFLDIDGSLFEGGGQMIRLALSLSVICQKPFRIFNIRAGRKAPGLAESHLVAVNLLASFGRSKVCGNSKGSECLTFEPGRAEPGNYLAECRTAGSVNLILQAALPVLISTESTLVITGGTDVDFSPPSHYIQSVLFPALNKIGISCSIAIEKHGFYPSGFGKIIVSTQPSRPSPLVLTEVEYSNWKVSILASQNIRNSNKFSEVLSEVKRNLLVEDEEIKVVYSKDKAVVVSMYCDSSFVPLHNSFIENFKNSQNNILEICEKSKRWLESRCAVDEYLQDQILVFLALAPGNSRIFVGGLTAHTEGVIYLLNLFGIAEVVFVDGFINISPLINYN